MIELVRTLRAHETYVITKRGLAAAEIAVWLGLPKWRIELWAKEALSSGLVRRSYLGGYRLTRKGKQVAKKCR